MADKGKPMQAVALTYEVEDGAPRVIAKGRGHLLRMGGAQMPPVL